ncbi:transcriptional regulator [Sphingomonas sp. CCH18-B1]|jgi:transcriptional regulator with XRE-family HTH domain|uniref:transcriptional regulator n=1 Tax=Sphingomonas sp. CCH18-B1 TaxID=1768744 RepID=UPI0008320D8F|nr:transcriptional regulator [Sphingomonas sp. CCH18-B1]
MTISVVERVRAVRLRSGPSEDCIAGSLGFTRRALLIWEAAIAEPPIAILKPLRMLYNVDIEWIVLGGNLKPASDFHIEQEVYPHDLSRRASTARINRGRSYPTEFTRKTP